ncbi:MAG: hypothetical protein LKK36_09280 [Ewingella americana]|jgi:hypothetical protein|uniref:hypothetical protein n=1 Tax=Ewingella americana TaxID=41202 RepID=UPI00242FEC78|nr:hypothetical protein [Ewingella americana]MCI1680456.1 hypothetical protein [Ewingella americana]MCI1856306.1 hypothetical protein [Ewingella americana]MCI1863977.1 hypothetical protein [Ewingella americana]MCI2142985.1 hypothetical protein [Ewingella americana]MCI2163870.1 hypothetical protein [Ewingella americana]
MTFRLTKIDELTRPDHYHLDESDNCYFFGEYTARKGFSHSDTNQLILNLKKGSDKKGSYEYRYKGRAIQQVANLITGTIGNLYDYTFVPIPPSKCNDDPAYDDRMTAILRLCLQTNGNLQFREMISQRISMEASHSSAARPSPAQIAANYQFDHNLTAGIRNTIVIFDDVLTAGSHYKAMKDTIRHHLPNVGLMGLFVARTARDAEWFDDSDLDD